MPEIGRFFNVDPLSEKYYHNSPYAFSENKVISHRELEGLEGIESIGSAIVIIGNYLFGDGDDGSERSAAEFGRAQQMGSAESQQNQEKLQDIKETVDDIPAVNVVGSLTNTMESNSVGEGMQNLGKATVQASAVIPGGPGRNGGATGKNGGTFGARQNTQSSNANQAFRNAKEQNGIPRSQQPDKVLKPNTPAGKGAGLDNRNVKQYEFKNSKGQTIIIRQDKPASYNPGGQGNQGPHYNAGDGGGKLKQHHYYGPEE